MRLQMISAFSAMGDSAVVVVNGVNNKRDKGWERVARSLGEVRCGCGVCVGLGSDLGGWEMSDC